MNILKYIIVVLIVFNTTISFSQKNNFIVSSPSVRVLYKGVSNIIQVGFLKKKSKFTVECIGCDTIIKLKKYRNLYTLKLGMDSLSEITILIKNKKGDEVTAVKYKTFFPPTPIIKLDNYFGFESIDSLPSTFKVVHENHIPLHINYLIFNWRITLNNKTFTGSGKNLSVEVIDFMKEIKNGLILVEIDYSGTFYKGKHEIIKEAFILNL